MKFQAEEIRRIVFESIEGVLGIDAALIQPQESLLNLGFDSLSLSRLAMRLSNELGVELLVPDLFVSPSVTALACQLGDAVEERAQATLEEASQPLSGRSEDRLSASMRR